MKRTKRKSVLLRLVALGIAAFVLVDLGYLWKQLRAKQNELNDLNAKQAFTQAQIDAYNELLRDGNEKRIVEQAARERLGYVYADEKVYIDISGN